MLDYITTLGLLSYREGPYCKTMENNLLTMQNFPKCTYFNPFQNKTNKQKPNSDTKLDLFLGLVTEQKFSGVCLFVCLTIKILLYFACKFRCLKQCYHTEHKYYNSPFPFHYEFFNMNGFYHFVSPKLVCIHYQIDCIQHVYFKKLIL